MERSNQAGIWVTVHFPQRKRERDFVAIAPAIKLVAFAIFLQQYPLVAGYSLWSALIIKRNYFYWCPHGPKDNLNQGFEYGVFT